MMRVREDKNSALIIANNIFFKEVNEYLTKGKDVLFTINGNSMLPFLAHGDKVIICPINKQNFTYGRILLAKSEYGYVLHRLVWKNNKNLWLAGDNNLVQLEKISREDVLGTVRFTVIKETYNDVHTYPKIILAFIWFFLRPFRLAVFKLKKIF